MSQELLGTDLMLSDSTHGKDFDVQDGDIVLVDGVNNLVQALSLRLTNNRGMLMQLGHPNYGSRLSEAVGRTNKPANLRLIENFVKEALLQEPRVKSIESVYISTALSLPENIIIEVAVLPIGKRTPLNLVVTIQTGND